MECGSIIHSRVEKPDMFKPNAVNVSGGEKTEE
jgi:hypothetical protein